MLFRSLRVIHCQTAHQLATVTNEVEAIQRAIGERRAAGEAAEARRRGRDSNGGEDPPGNGGGSVSSGRG